jgi:hypothetical protein
MKKKLCVFLVLVCAILCATFAQSAAAADFSGEWHRTNVDKMDEATITITNVTDKSFDFSFEGYHAANSGEMEGTAVFTDKDRAVYEYKNEDMDWELTLTFVMNDGELSVSCEGSYFGLFGTGVYIDGEYTKGEPAYTNADIVLETLGGNADRVKELMGEDAFNGLVLVMEEGGASEVEGLTYSGFIRGVGMGADLLVDGGKIYCLALNLDGNFDGYTFYTNDENYKEELPAVMKENFNDSWDLKFVYKTGQ